MLLILIACVSVLSVVLSSWSDLSIVQCRLQTMLYMLPESARELSEMAYGIPKLCHSEHVMSY